MRNENAPPLDQCEAGLDEIKVDIFELFQKENPEFKDAVLTKAECVDASEFEPDSRPELKCMILACHIKSQDCCHSSIYSHSAPAIRV